MKSKLAWFPVAAALTALLSAQTPPPTITLQDALAGARKYGGQIQGANLNALQAKEDTKQARANRLPWVSAFNQFIYTEGNGTPTGLFVAANGVHVYNEQAVVHEELLSLLRQGEVRRALAAEEIAHAKAEVTSRGLNATVIVDYYAIVAAQRHAVNINTSVGEAEHFLDITRKQEKGGEAAHSDVIKADIDLRQRQRDLAETQLAIEKAKMALGILIFPDFTAAYNVVDDLQQPPPLPAAEEAKAHASVANPDLQMAEASLKEAGLEIVVAKYQYLPSFGLDFFYGLDSNQFSAHTTIPGDPGHPPFQQNNLGYSAQATLNIPVWNWGSTRSKVKQAEYHRDQANLDLSLTRRTLQGNIAAAHAEAQTAQSQVESLRASVDLAAENLRLTLLRYQAGESTAFEVVDAQNTVTQARNAVDDGLTRYRIAVANLQILMGTF
jgi:outer membrane protein TolC